MNLGFNQLVDLSPAEKPEIDNNDEYIELHSFLHSAHEEFCELANAYNKALVAQSVLKKTPVDNGTYNVLCDMFGLEELVGLPRNSINAVNSQAYTAVCMEGLGSFLVTIAKRIGEFFKKLYETIMRFFGIRNFRHRRMENELIRIKKAVTVLEDSTFRAIAKTDVRVNAPTVNLATLDTILGDMEQMYNLLMTTKDVENIKGLVNATSGMLNKLGYQVVDEYHIQDPVANGAVSGLPYTEFEAGTIITPDTSIGIRGKNDIVGRIDRALNLQKTLIDVQRWYPMNLQKYASRAEKSTRAPEAEAEKTLQVLNEDQKCQAYNCKFIVTYMQIVDYMCARTVASFGMFARE